MSCTTRGTAWLRQVVEQGRQEGQRREQGHDHADRRQDAELGQPQIGRGHEGEEADRGTDRRQRQPRCRPAGGGEQRPGTVLPEPQRLAVAQQEVDAEIDPDAQEQDDERHRDQVEPADRQETQCRRQHESDQQVQQSRQDQLPGPQAQHEEDGDDPEAHQRGEAGAVLDAFELLLVQRRPACQPDRDPIRRKPAPSARRRSIAAPAGSICA